MPSAYPFHLNTDGGGIGKGVRLLYSHSAALDPRLSQGGQGNPLRQRLCEIGVAIRSDRPGRQYHTLIIRNSPQPIRPDADRRRIILDEHVNSDDDPLWGQFLMCPYPKQCAKTQVADKNTTKPSCCIRSKAFIHAILPLLYNASGDH
jgi:hypothetical protein